MDEKIRKAYKIYGDDVREKLLDLIGENMKELKLSAGSV